MVGKELGKRDPSSAINFGTGRADGKARGNGVNVSYRPA